MRAFLTLPGLLLIAGLGSAGPAPLQWTANFNPATGGEEQFRSAVTTASGETHVLYVIGDRNLKIARFDNTGASLGVVTLENSGKDFRNDLGLAIDASGNYVVAGRGHTSDDTEDLGAAKWTSSGDLIWATLRVTSGYDESGQPNGMGLDAAGNVYVIGSEDSGNRDTVVMKFDSSGVFQWESFTDGANDNTPYAFTVLPAGGAAYVAYYQSTFGSRIRAVDSGGVQTFSSTCYNYMALGASATSFVAALQSGGQLYVDELSSANGSFIRRSPAASFNGGPYPDVVDVRPSGEIFVGGMFGMAAGQVPFVAVWGPTQNNMPVRWSRTYDVGTYEGGSGNVGMTMTFDVGGTVYLVNGIPHAGMSVFNNCSEGGDLVLRRANPTTGAPQFRTVWDGPLNAAATGMAGDSAGDFYVTTESPARLVKYNAAGTLQWSRSFTSSTVYCVTSMNKVIVDATEVYVLMDARISATFCCLADEEDLLVARYNRTTGVPAGFWSWTPGGEINIGPVRFNGAGTVLYVGYGEGSGGGKIAGVTAFNKTTGAVQWSRTFAQTVIDSVTGLSVDFNGDLYASFPYMNPDSTMVTWIRKLNSSGAELWTRTITTGTGSPLVLGLGTAAVPTVGGIYLGGGEADNFPPSQTYFNGFLQRIDASGNLLFTRTYNGGQQLAYFATDVTPAGVPIMAGFSGPAFQFGEGINAGGAGNIVVHAWEQDGLGCMAPLWGALYDSGYGDEQPQALVAGSAAVGFGTSNGPMIAKYGDGASDAPVLDTRITISPNPASLSPTAEVVTIVVTTTNTGGRDALSVAPLLTAVSGSTTFTTILGPVPAGAVTLVGGASRSWTWSATVAGAGTAYFSLTVSGYDTCGGALVTGTRYASAVTGHRADMVGDMWRTGSVFGIGDLMGLTLTVTNNGIASALVNSVSVTLFQVGGPILTPAGDVVRGTGPLAAGASGIMSWTFTATSAGAVNLVEQAGWVDALFGFAKPGNSGGDSVTVYSQARFQSAISVSPSPSSVGQVFTVRLTVTNVGAFAATGVIPSLDVNTGSGILTAKGVASPAGPVVIGAGLSQSFAWTFTSTGAGIIAFTATAQGTDASPLGYVARASQGWGGFVQTPPVLRGQIVLTPTTIEVGQNVVMALTVTNSGQATAYGVQNKMNDFGTATVFMTAGPFPAWSSTLAGGQTILYTATAVGVTVGTFWNSATVWGYDGNSGATIYSTPFTSNAITVLQAPILTVALSAYRKGVGPQTHIGQSFLVTATVYNTGGITANNVAPQPSLITAGTGTAVQIAGPSPATPVASIAPGAFAVFSWTLTGQAPGALVLATTVTGVSAFSGNTISSGLAVSNGMVVSRLLTSSLTINPGSINGGQVATAAMTITNTGADIVAAIKPYLFIAPGTSATSGAASNTNFLLNPGESQTVTWALSGLEAGDVSVTAYASGLDAIDSSVPVSATAVAGVVVTGTLSSRIAVVPATVKAGQTFEIRYTVSKSGSSVIQNLTPALVIGDPSLATIESGPTPAVVATLINTDPQPTFVWTLRALKTGNVGIQASASGNIISPPGPDSTQASVSVTINPALDIPSFEGDAIVFPNPVTGDVMQLAVKLEPDTDKIVMEVYNTGFQRVYHGEWTGLTGSATLLDIKGLNDWAPGPYFIRMTGTSPAGTKVYKTVRMRIKRTVP